jgi:hypothetical protein
LLSIFCQILTAISRIGKAKVRHKTQVTIACAAARTWWSYSLSSLSLKRL